MPTRDHPAGPLADRARAWLDAGSPAGPQPRLAATVELLRDGPHGLEVFVLRRVATMAFAPSVLVFPGGGVDPRDADLPVPGADAAGRALVPAGVVVAAAREVFEETGVLLAEPSGGAATAPAPSALAADRRAVESRELAFSGLLDRHGLRLRADLLSLRAHWVTPAFEARRYDTYFYAAVVPAGQEPDGDTTEADDARWVRPADALAEHARGEVALLPPTVVALEDLARFGSAADVLADTRPVPRVEPTAAVARDDVVIRVTTPDEPAGA